MRRSILSFSVAATLIALSQPIAAQSLSFAPQRVIIEARLGSAELSLTNTGKREESYRIELVDMIYQDDGKVVQSKETPVGYPSAKPLIRFSPSQVRLAAGEQQKVRILVKSKDGLADGEYRVHAVMHQLPNVSDVKPTAPIKGAITGVVGVEQAVAIPVILRVGNTDAKGSIASIKIGSEGKNPALDIKLARTGNRSLYTNLVLKDKAGAVAKEVKGVAVPVPNQQRRFVFALEGIDAAKLKSGGYTLEMLDHDGGAVLDKKVVQ